jgi:hypothetical protein
MAPLLKTLAVVLVTGAIIGGISLVIAIPLGFVI